MGMLTGYQTDCGVPSHGYILHVFLKPERVESGPISVQLRDRVPQDCAHSLRVNPSNLE